jgi:uncharacterized delta-60 repeat protein
LIDTDNAAKAGGDADMSKRLWQIFCVMVWAATALCRAAPGDLDAGFGTSGKVNVQAQLALTDPNGRAIALQPDGKVLVAGYWWDTAGSSKNLFLLVRFTPGGAVDTSFGNNGVVSTMIGAASAEASGVAVQPDGKILVTGSCLPIGTSNATEFCLSRYLSNGTLDTSFNVTGTLVSNIVTGRERAHAVALQPDGKILVAGTCDNVFSDDFCVVRYLSNGALDVDFGVGGRVFTAIGNGNDTARAIALRPDGRIVVAGACVNDSISRFCVAQYHNSGALDGSFSGDGKLITTMGSADASAHAVALQHDGRVVVAGTCVNGSNDFCLARYLENGTLDTSFNGTGRVLTAMSAGADSASGLVVQPDGKLVAVGTCSNDFCGARYLPNGSLDTSFSADGKVTTDISGFDVAGGVALQPDGNIVVAGACNPSPSDASSLSVCLARYQGGPNEARICTLDIDGDNRVLATTDALIYTRISLGMSGSSVLAGITFASHATRNSWPLIRDYLVTQCGMTVAPG